MAGGQPYRVVLVESLPGKACLVLALGPASCALGVVANLLTIGHGSSGHKGGRQGSDIELHVGQFKSMEGLFSNLGWTQAVGVCCLCYGPPSQDEEADGQ